MNSVMMLLFITTVAVQAVQPASQRRAGACAASSNPPCIVASAISVTFGGVVVLIGSPGTLIIETGQGPICTSKNSTAKPKAAPTSSVLRSENRSSSHAYPSTEIASQTNR